MKKTSLKIIPFFLTLFYVVESHAVITMPFSQKSQEQPSQNIAIPFKSSNQAGITQEGKVLDTIVAVVNDDVITERELNKYTDGIKSQLADNQTNAPSEPQLRLQVLNHLIDQKIELQTAEKAGIDVDENAVDDAIKKIAQNNNLSVDELKNRLESEGTSYSDYRQDVRNQLTINQILQREVASKVMISQQEIDKYMNSVAYDQKKNIAEYHLADILISLPEIPSPKDMQAANQRADLILAKLKEGKNFSELAVAYSDAKEGLQGGDLGWRRGEEVPTIFASTIETLKPGDFAGPIRTPNGLHFVKVIDVRGSATRHYVTETHVQHILLRPEVINDDVQTKAKISHLRARIEQGESFANIAKEYSQDKISAANGGDLGWVLPGQMVLPFENAMNKQAIGLVGEPVKSEFGWHIIQVLERREKDDTMQHQEAEIRKMIFDRQFAEKAQVWVKRMRSASYVQILIPTELKPFEES